MDFIDALRQFSARAEKMIGHINSEQATKTSLIMPFFQQVLGYDVFNPSEFVPEFTADVGTKKGEKVDYCIQIDGNPVILVEAKAYGESLEKHDGQLLRYFNVTPAKFGILTNGIIYKFYTDLEEKNKMDLSPFLELDILSIKDSFVPELKRFCRSNFDASEIFNRASELKYTNEIKRYFTEQLSDPSDEFVRFMISCAFEGVKTASIVEKFRPIVKSSLNNLISEMMSDRITSALKNETVAKVESEPIYESNDTEDDDQEEILPTEDEFMAYKIIKAILVEHISASEVTYKDTTRYFAVLYKGMPSKWICRFRLGGKKSYIGLPNEEGKETLFPMQTVDDIYGFKDLIVEAAKRFEH